MQVTATEFKVNMGHYLKLVEKEDIWIFKNGKMVARVINPNISAVDALSGILKDRVPEDTDRNSRDFSGFGIPVYSPEEMLAKLQS